MLLQTHHVGVKNPVEALTAAKNHKHFPAQRHQQNQPYRLPKFIIPHHTSSFRCGHVDNSMCSPPGQQFLVGRAAPWKLWEPWAAGHWLPALVQRVPQRGVGRCGSGCGIAGDVADVDCLGILENHRKTMGKPWANCGLIWFNMKFIGLPSGVIKHG